MSVMVVVVGEKGRERYLREREEEQMEREAVRSCFTNRARCLVLYTPFHLPVAHCKPTFNSTIVLDGEGQTCSNEFANNVEQSLGNGCVDVRIWGYTITSVVTHPFARAAQ
jgi:hypothetical protein